MILITFYCSALIKNTLLMPYIFNIRARVAPIVNWFCKQMCSRNIITKKFKMRSFENNRHKLLVMLDRAHIHTHSLTHSLLTCNLCENEIFYDTYKHANWLYRRYSMRYLHFFLLVHNGNDWIVILRMWFFKKIQMHNIWEKLEAYDWC